MMYANKDERIKMLRGLFFAAVACILLSVPSAAQLTAQQRAGMQIYMKGTSASDRPVEAVLGNGSTTVPAQLLSCASCHGSDGKGKAEGNVVPSDITWDALTRELRSDDPLTRRRHPYTPELLRRAITMGLDPDGHPLGITMPHFKMQPADLDDLLAYLRVVGAEPEAGISPASIRLGTLVSSTGPRSPMEKNLSTLLGAYFDEINRQGGVYNRKIDFQVLQADQQPGKTIQKIEDSNIFAMLNPLPPGPGHDFNGVLEQAGIPSLSTFVSTPEASNSTQSKAFYMLSGIVEEAVVLADFACQNRDLGQVHAAIVYPRSMAGLAGMISQRCRTAHIEAGNLPYENFDGEAAAKKLMQQEINTVLFLGGGADLMQLLASGANQQWKANVFQPGGLADGDLFDVATDQDPHLQLFLAYPTLPSDIEPQSFREYQSLVEQHQLSSSQPVLALAALASAKVLVEGLRAAGRQLDRQKLVASLSAVDAFNTGIVPPVTFGDGKRIGVMGAYIVKLDIKNKRLTQVGSWKTP